MAGVHAHRTARLGPGLHQGRLGGGWGRETDPRVLMGRNQWCSTGTGLNGCKRPTISGTDQASTAHSFDVVPVCAHACEHSRRCGALGRGSKEDAAGGEASRTARLALGRPPAAEPGAQRDPERYTLRMPTRSCPYGAGPQTPSECRPPRRPGRERPFCRLDGRPLDTLRPGLARGFRNREDDATHRRIGVRRWYVGMGVRP